MKRNTCSLLCLVGVFALVLALAPAAMAQFSLKIDFGQPDTAVQEGYLAYTAEQETPATFTAQDFTAFGTTITILPTWEAGATDEAMQMYDRGAQQVDTPDLLTDWIGTDGRQVGNPLTLTLTGVPAGNYTWFSYHHDVQDQTGIFDVTVTDATGPTVLPDNQITDRETDGIVTVAAAATFETTITSDGSPITLAFSNVSLETDPVDLRFFLMNAFELTKVGSYVFPLDGTQSGTGSTALGCGTVILNDAQDRITVEILHNVSNPTAAHICLDGGGIEIDLGSAASPITGDFAVTAQQVTDLLAGNLYVNVSNDLLGGDIRGQIVLSACPETPDLGSDIIPSSAFAIAGQYFSLTAPGYGPYQWSDESGPISGATDQVLAFDPVEEADSGMYSVTFDDGSFGKLPASASYDLFVYPAGTVVSLTGLLGLGLLAGACAVGGASALRRKK